MTAALPPAAAALCAGAFTATAPAPAHAADDARERISLEFVGRVALMPMMRAQVDAEVWPDRYEGGVTFRSAGVLGFFRPARIEGRGRGWRGESGLTPDAYRHVEINGRKRREVSLAYEPADVVVEATPPFGSLGEPAPTAEQRRQALDPLSMILQITLQSGPEPCARVVPVFDSKLRYDLEFHPDGVEEELNTAGYRGPAVRCRVYYRPIAGYDPEDLADDDVYATPIRVWLAEIAPGVTAPALIRARFASAILPLSVKLELREARVDVAPGSEPG
jgi:hypothetical protein